MFGRDLVFQLSCHFYRDRGTLILLLPLKPRPDIRSSAKNPILLSGNLLFSEVSNVQMSGRGGQRKILDRGLLTFVSYSSRCQGKRKKYLITPPPPVSGSSCSAFPAKKSEKTLSTISLISLRVRKSRKCATCVQKRSFILPPPLYFLLLCFLYHCSECA